MQLAPGHAVWPQSGAAIAVTKFLYLILSRLGEECGMPRHEVVGTLHN